MLLQCFIILLIMVLLCNWARVSDAYVPQKSYKTVKVHPKIIAHHGYYTNIPRILQASKDDETSNKSSVLEQVASKGLAGVLAIAVAEAIFWALGMPLAAVWVKLTTGEWLDLSTTEGQLQAAGFSFGYGGFATLILQYRVTLFAIPLVPVMEKLVVEPGKKLFGDQFGSKKD